MKGMGMTSQHFGDRMGMSSQQFGGRLPSSWALYETQPTRQAAPADFGSPRAHATVHGTLVSPRRVTQRDYLSTFGMQIAKDLGESARLQQARAAAARNAERFPVLERFPITGLAGRSHRGRDPTIAGPKDTGWMPPSGRWTEHHEQTKSGPNSKRVDERVAMDVQARAFGLAPSDDSRRPSSARTPSSHLRLHAQLEQERQLKRTMDEALARANVPASMVLFG